MHHVHIAHLTTARDALHAATCHGHFPEREEVVGLVERVDAIVQAGSARASAGPTPSAEEAPLATHVCPFSACADTGLLPNGDLCACVGVAHG